MLGYQDDNPHGVTETVLPNIGDMTEKEIIEELVAEQRGIIERMEPHARVHQVVRIRTQRYMNELFSQAKCHAPEEEGPLGFLSPDGSPGQYL